MFEDLRNIRGSREDFRKFAITVGIILALFGAIFFWEEKGAFRYFWAISAFLLLTGITVPMVLKPLYYFWMGMATILGWIVSRVILSILFYIVFTPIGVIARLFGKHFLDLNWNKTAGSYWNYRDDGSKPIDRYEKQF